MHKNILILIFGIITFILIAGCADTTQQIQPTAPTVSLLTTTSASEFTYKNPSSSSVNTKEIEKAIYRLTNNERKNAGLSALEWNEMLAVIAREHSIDMAKNGFFSHINLRGEGPNERAAHYGYPIEKTRPNEGVYMIGIAENIGEMPTGDVIGIGYVQRGPDSIAEAQVKSWMGSFGHRSNILNSEYDVIGVGVAYDGSLYYISTQNFQ